MQLMYSSQHYFKETTSVFNTNLKKKCRQSPSTQLINWYDFPTIPFCLQL